MPKDIYQSGVIHTNNSALNVSSSPPSDPKTGDIYYNPEDYTEYVWNGSDWVSKEVFTKPLPIRSQTQRVFDIPSSTVIRSAERFGVYSNIYVESVEATFYSGQSTNWDSSNVFDFSWYFNYYSTDSPNSAVTKYISSNVIINEPQPVNMSGHRPLSFPGLGKFVVEKEKQGFVDNMGMLINVTGSPVNNSTQINYAELRYRTCLY